MYIRNPETNEWEEVFLPPTGDTLPIGAITEFGGETAPTNWLFCNGQAVSRETYAELFSVIGTTYGEGDGSTTFNVPDFSSRSPMGVGTGTDGTNSETTILGQEKGEYKHTLTENEIPPLTTYAPSQTSGGNMAYLSNWSGYNGSGLGTIPITKTKTTNAEAHNTIHPVLGVNFIIKAKQSIGLVGNVVSDINATGDNDVAPTKVIKEYVDKKQTYSTNEIVIGTYLGKPLYRKVLTGTLPTGSGENKFNITSGVIRKAEGFIKSIYGFWFTLNDNYTKETGYIIETHINEYRSQLIVTCGSFYATSSAYEIIVEYTKTTDV